MKEQENTTRQESKKDGFSPLRYVIELMYLERIGNCRWWEFGKIRKVNRWRKKKLLEYGFTDS